MIDRPQPREPLSPTNAAASFRAFTSAQDAMAIHRHIVGAAAYATGVEDDPKLRKAYVELAARYLWSPIKAQTPTARIELGDLSTMDECLDALRTIAHAQAEDHMSVEAVEGALKVVERAMHVHRSQTAERALEALEDAGGVPFFLSAGQSADENGSRLAAFLKAQEGAEN